MIVTLQDANELHETLDCEVFHDKIVVECSDGFWYCLCDNKADNFDDVKWYEAKPWMIQAMGRLQGKGVGHVNDQLQDERIREFATIEVEEKYATQDEYYSFDINDAMPGAFGNEYANVEFSL